MLPRSLLLLYVEATLQWVKQTEMDDDDAWDYIIVMPLRKVQVDDVSGHLCEH